MPYIKNIRTEEESPTAVVVTPVWAQEGGEPEIDRPASYSIVLSPRNALRFIRAAKDGAAFADVRIAEDVNGQTYVAKNAQVVGKYADYCLTELGY